MARSRFPRVLDPYDRERALTVAKEARRRASVAILHQSPIGGPVHMAATGVLRALDGLAGALTGDPESGGEKIPHGSGRVAWPRWR
jgi:hypothetical protein